MILTAYHFIVFVVLSYGILSYGLLTIDLTRSKPLDYAMGYGAAALAVVWAMIPGGNALLWTVTAAYIYGLAGLMRRHTQDIMVCLFLAIPSTVKLAFYLYHTLA